MTRQRRRSLATWLAATALAAAALMGAGCGDDDEGAEGAATATAPAETSTTASSSPEQPLGIAPYTGFESKLPTEYPEPDTSKGKPYTVGFLNPLAANETLTTLQNAVVAETERLGGKVIAKDAQLDPDKQISGFEQLLAADVDVIIYYPLDPKALEPVLRKAQKQGVKAIGIDVTYETDQPVPPNTVTQVWQTRDWPAYLEAAAVSKLKPQAKTLIVGIGAPVPSLKFWQTRANAWADELGLDVVGEAENPTDDVAGAEKAAQGPVAQNPDLQAVIAYNDSSGLGARSVARGAGIDPVIVGANGGEEGTEAVRTGRLNATVRTDPVGWGVQSARAAFLTLFQPDVKLPRIIVRPPTLITKDNIDDVPTWQQALAQIK